MDIRNHSHWEYRTLLPEGFDAKSNSSIQEEHRGLLRIEEFPIGYEPAKGGALRPVGWNPDDHLPPVGEEIQWLQSRSPTPLLDTEASAIVLLTQEVRSAGTRMPFRFIDSFLLDAPGDSDDSWSEDGPVTGLLDIYASEANRFLDLAAVGRDEGHPETADQSLPRFALEHAAAGIALAEACFPSNFNGLIRYNAMDNRPFWHCLFALSRAYLHLGWADDATHVARTMLFLDPVRMALEVAEQLEGIVLLGPGGLGETPTP